MKKIIMAGLFCGLTTIVTTNALAENQPPADDAIAKAETAMAGSEDTTAGEKAPTSIGDVFGLRSGYVHPFMSVAMLTSDNIYNAKDDEIGDWSTIYSPGIWLAVPRTKEAKLSVATSNTAPGGLSMFNEKTESFSRYQGFASYGADIEEYNSHTERNTVKQAAEGFLQYNFRGGLSIDLIDKYIDSEDPLGTGDSTVIDAFKHNLVQVIADYRITDKIRFRADYNNFHLNYDLNVSSGMDRDDNSYAGYLFYKYSPKTSAFINYQYVDVNYDTNTIQDNKQNQYKLGINWAPTVKTKLIGLIGITDRSSDNTAGDTSAFTAQLTAAHQLTAKTSLQIVAAQQVSESTVSTAAYSNDTTISVSVREDFTLKIAGNLEVSYGRFNFHENTGAWSRTDHTYSFAPSLRYMFKDWLMADLGYEYSERDSDNDAYDYNTNKIYVKVSAGF
ncbi:MAG: outer membrane beta-barrel protein [Desulfobulbaceae bacterium]|nr:outer membrane beta-barrel protein [Desulfobulbaceae bacterium]